MNQQPKITRRKLLGSAAAGTTAAMTAASYARVVGANQRVGVGFIGYGLIGKRHVIDFQQQKDVEMVGLADAHRGRRDEAVEFIRSGGEAKNGSGKNARGYDDFRKLLDDSQVDAVVVSTPDHWHGLMTMMACAAGKDVYVEKPLSLFVQEGRWMVDVAKRHGRVVQVGTQQRSGKHYQRARELIQSGAIGDIVSVKMQAARNIMPGYGSKPNSNPPPQLDYNMWLGPAPLRAYNPLRAIYHFRWYWDYSGGQMTNLGQHSLDIVDWIVGVGDLKSVVSVGGRQTLRDGGETSDRQDAIFTFARYTATWSHREVSKGSRGEYGLEFFGTKGSLGISRSGFRITADDKIPPPNTVPQFTGAHPVGGPKPVEITGLKNSWTEAILDETGDGRAQFKDHVRNFLDCIKTRKTPVSDLQSGHRVVTLCHLANISMRLDRPISWDPKREEIIGDEEASDRLARTYREPWETIRRSLTDV